MGLEVLERIRTDDNLSDIPLSWCLHPLNGMRIDKGI